MNLDITRYGETGYVRDFGAQNAVIATVAVLLWAGVTLAFILWVTTPAESGGAGQRRASRLRRLSPLVVVLLAMGGLVSVLAGRLYAAPVFPEPPPTRTVIMAESLPDAVLNALLSDGRVTAAGFRDGSDLAIESGELREAAPATHRVALSLTLHRGDELACSGTATVEPPRPVHTLDLSKSEVARLDADIALLDGNAVPIRVRLDCHYPSEVLSYAGHQRVSR